MQLHVSADVRVPGDKSISHRALLLAAAARGESRLRGVLPGADCRSTAAVLRSLGCPVPQLPADGAGIVVRSGGLRAWREPGGPLDCGNSGTTVRLLMGLLAGRPFCSRLAGDASLQGRPMRRVTGPLGAMGARVRELGAPDRLPVELCGGALTAFHHRSPTASAQVKSAVLLAGVSGGVPVSVHEPVRSRDHTERMLRGLGAAIHEGAAEDGGWLVELQPPDGDLPGFALDVPGDPSSAAFLLAVSLLAASGELRVREVALNPTRTGFLGVLARMGARVETEGEREEGGEPVGDLVAYPSRLKGTVVTGEEVPALIDEVPILAALAARAEGETRITGADELRAKESDRIAALVANLRALGVEADELPDGLVVRGTERPLRGRVRTFHDHRIAMAFGVLGLLPGNQIEIESPEVVDVSFPGFWKLLPALVAGRGARTPARPDPPRIP
jgi:3-phosphoshikimate 1-carboxyvinyltransferase